MNPSNRAIAVGSADGPAMTPMLDNPRSSKWRAANRPPWWLSTPTKPQLGPFTSSSSSTSTRGVCDAGQRRPKERGAGEVDQTVDALVLEQVDVTLLLGFVELRVGQEDAVPAV